MKQYLDLLRYVLEKGDEKADRTGTGTNLLFMSYYGSLKATPIYLT